jgi:hypothetical protein
MLTYKGGNRVGKGTYWDLSKGQRIDVAEEAILSGDSSSTYYRIPAGVLLLAGPVVGLLYVILLPFIGITTIVMLALQKVAGGTLSLIGKSLSFGWRPKEAYLSGKKKSKKEPK